MDEIKLDSIKSKLDSVILNIKHAKDEETIVTPYSYDLGLLKDALNELFEEENIKCTDVLYTINTDKQFFGVTISPAIDGTDVIRVLTTNDPVKLSNYKLELDSKLFDLDLDTDEILSIIIFDISSMFSQNTIDQLRNLLTIYVLSQDTLSIRDSINYHQLLVFGFKDTMRKISSILYKDDIEEILVNDAIKELKLDDALVSAQEKIISSAFGSSDSVRSPKVIILQWVFMTYKDISHNARITKDTLYDAIDFSGSVLMKDEINKTLKALDRIGITIGESVEELLDKNNMTAVNELSLFKSLKQSGLRAIEDDYYEYAIKCKAAEDEPEAMSALHSINTRISILDDYIYNTPEITDAERKRYEKLADKYRDLREYLSKKKIINKKQYGVFIDYSQYDHLDDEEE